MMCIGYRLDVFKHHLYNLSKSLSLSHDIIQEQYGYQRHSISDNRYITYYSGKKEFSTTICRLISVQNDEWQQVPTQR